MLVGQALSNDQPGPGVAITPEGWFVTDSTPFRRLVDHPPPRPGCFLHLLMADARHWKVVAFWVVGGGLLAWAVVTQEWIMAVPGVLVLATWARMFRATLADLRHCPLLIGVMEALGPPPHVLLGDQATARAWLADGQEIRVLLPIRLGRVCLEGSGRAEVLVLYNPQALWSCVIGARPLGRC
jgi:hypothetical protein